MGSRRRPRPAALAHSANSGCPAGAPIRMSATRGSRRTAARSTPPAPDGRPAATARSRHCRPAHRTRPSVRPSSSMTVPPRARGGPAGCGSRPPSRRSAGRPRRSGCGPRSGGSPRRSASQGLRRGEARDPVRRLFGERVEHRRRAQERQAERVGPGGAARATTLWYSPPGPPRPGEPVHPRPPRPVADPPRCPGPPARMVFRIPPASLTSRTPSSSPASSCRPASTQPGRVSGTSAPIATPHAEHRLEPRGDPPVTRLPILRRSGHVSREADARAVGHRLFRAPDLFEQAMRAVVGDRVTSCWAIPKTNAQPRTWAGVSKALRPGTKPSHHRHPFAPCGQGVSG